MPTNNNQNVQGATQTTAQQQGKSSNKTIIYIAIAVVVIAVIVGLLFILSGTNGQSSSATTVPTHSESSTPIYLSSGNAQQIVGSPVSSYNTYDVFNPNSTINITTLEYIEPQLAGNATSGWLTAAAGSNLTQNVSTEYIVLQTSNTQSIVNGLGANLTAGLNMTLQAKNSGLQNGLNYTYYAFTNSTSDYYIVYGWKGNYAVVLLVQSNSGYAVNETQTVGIAANDIP